MHLTVGCPSLFFSTKCQQWRGVGPLYHPDKNTKLYPSPEFLGAPAWFQPWNAKFSWNLRIGAGNREEGIRSLPAPILAVLLFQGIWVLPCSLPVKGGFSILNTHIFSCFWTSVKLHALSKKRKWSGSMYKSVCVRVCVCEQYRAIF